MDISSHEHFGTGIFCLNKHTSTRTFWHGDFLAQGLCQKCASVLKRPLLELKYLPAETSLCRKVLSPKNSPYWKVSELKCWCNVCLPECPLNRKVHMPKCLYRNVCAKMSVPKCLFSKSGVPKPILNTPIGWSQMLFQQEVLTELLKNSVVSLLFWSKNN